MRTIMGAGTVELGKWRHALWPTLAAWLSARSGVTP